MQSTPYYFGLGGGGGGRGIMGAKNGAPKEK